MNLLAGDQAELSHAFARTGGDKFAGIDWYPSPGGSPILRGCVTWIDCDLHQEIETGDHMLVLGRVLGLEVARNTEALLFHRGGYAQTSLAETFDQE